MMTFKNRPRQRLIIIAVAGVILVIAALLSAYGLRSYAAYFQSPTDIVQNPPAPEQLIRIGGLVVEKSLVQIQNNPPYYSFQLTDGKTKIYVIYQGVLPDLFRDNQGIVAEGYLPAADKPLQATRVLAKHDEYYRPPEVERALKDAAQQ